MTDVFPGVYDHVQSCLETMRGVHRVLERSMERLGISETALQASTDRLMETDGRILGEVGRIRVKALPWSPS